MGLDMTTFDAVLKDLYLPQTVEDLVYKKNPLLALMPKMTNFVGRNLPTPLIYGNPQGRSATFSQAQTRGAATSTLSKDFVVTRVKDYSIATIETEVMRASKNDAGAFIKALTTEIDGALHSLTRSTAIAMYRNKSGSIGQVYAEPAETSGTFTFRLKNIQEITNFEVGQEIVIWTAETGGTQRNSDGTDDEWVISAVNRSTGFLTLTGDYTSSGTIAADNYIFINGDRGLRQSGLDDWIPSSTPSATLFFGVDRTSDPTRLGGLRLDASSLPIEEGLIEACALGGREGAMIDHCFLDFAMYAQLEKSLGSKVQYVDMMANANVMFRGILLNGPTGPIKVVPDQNCQPGLAWMLQLDSWELATLGPVVSIFDDDGLEVQRLPTADGVEVRCSFMGNVRCFAPGWNVRVTLQT